MSKIKSQLRTEYKNKRKNICNKSTLDDKVQNNFLNSELYKKAKVIFCYCALGDEISTDDIILKAFDDGKLVAVPRCLDKNGNMDFYIINSLNDLSSGAYSIREPIKECLPVPDFGNAVIIVPALCFDEKGHRLGYGKGYYDRYLQKHSLISAGLCYNSNIVNQLPANEYDQSVDYIFSQDKIYDCKNGGKNG